MPQINIFFFTKTFGLGKYFDSEILNMNFLIIIIIIILNHLYSLEMTYWQFWHTHIIRWVFTASDPVQVLHFYLYSLMMIPPAFSLTFCRHHTKSLANQSICNCLTVFYNSVLQRYKQLFNTHPVCILSKYTGLTMRWVPKHWRGFV